MLDFFVPKQPLLLPIVISIRRAKQSRLAMTSEAKATTACHSEHSEESVNTPHGNSSLFTLHSAFKIEFPFSINPIHISPTFAPLT